MSNIRDTVANCICILILASCSATPDFIGGVSSKNFIDQAAANNQPLSILSIVGGLSVVAGMVLLVVTAGRKGWFPSIGGILLVLLNYMVARYDDYLFYPLVVCTGLISAAWTYKVVRQILTEKKAKWKP